MGAAMLPVVMLLIGTMMLSGIVVSAAILLRGIATSRQASRLR